MIDETFWLLTASRIAGIGLVISLTILMATFSVWLSFIYFERQYKRLISSLGVRDVHEFGKEYRQWKSEQLRKEQE